MKVSGGTQPIINCYTNTKDFIQGIYTTATGSDLVAKLGDGETTGILNIGQFDNWYDLQGRRLNGKPTRQGVYINNGCSVIIK